MSAILGITLIGIYLSLVIGSAIKFADNGIQLTFVSKILLLFLPLILFSLHVKMAIENIHKNNKMAAEIILMATLRYPLALGLLIEVMLERSAQKAVFGSEKIKHRKQGTPIEITAKQITKPKGFMNIYQKTVNHA